MPVTLFYGHAHEGDALHDELKNQLTVFERRGLIPSWFAKTDAE